MGEKDGRKIGKTVGGAVYLHRSALGGLTGPQQLKLAKALDLAGDIAWNVAKFDLAAPWGLSLLDYEDFSQAAFPALQGSYRLDADNGALVHRRYGSDNPPIVHRKELMVRPDHPQRSEWEALTRSLEAKGLFTNMSRRGRLRPWVQALEQAGLQISGNAVVPLATGDPDILRHKTAIAREGLSAPVAALYQAGLLTAGTSFLDYGCGRGDDVENLRSAGLDASGWDPHFAPDITRLKPSQFVNLGFVLNVIEDPSERVRALQDAFSYATEALSVAVMLAGKADISGQKPHADGYLTARGTFQKYFTQAELRALITQSLGIAPIPAGAGLFLVFKDEEGEQKYLRQRLREGLRLPRLFRERPNSQTGGPGLIADELRDEVAGIFLQLGRQPHADELPETLRARLRAARVSLPRVLDAVRAELPAETLQQAVSRAQLSLCRFFAIQTFSGRAAYKTLSPSLQRDIRSHFGGLPAAETAGKKLLFSAGDSGAMMQEAQKLETQGIGSLQDNKFTIRTEHLESLPARFLIYTDIARYLSGDLPTTGQITFHIGTNKLTCREPLSDGSEQHWSVTRVNLRTGEVDSFRST